MSARLALVAIISSSAVCWASPASDRALDALSAERNQFEATSASPELSVARQSLDTDLVLTIVKERLEQAAMKLAADSLAKLGVNADRPWAKDLLSSIPELATSPPDLQRQRAEESLRIIIRAVLAETSVRVGQITWSDAGVDPKDKDPAFRSHLAGWVYWRLARVAGLAGKASVPDCSLAGDAEPLCRHLAGLDEAARVTVIDQLTGAGWMFDAFAVLHDVQKQSNQGFTPKVMVQALFDYDDWHLKQVSTALAAVQARLGVLPGLASRWVSLMVWWNNVRRNIPAFQKALSDATLGTSNAALEAKPFLDAVDLKLDGSSASELVAAVARASPLLKPFCDRVSEVIAFRANWQKASTLDRVAMVQKLEGLEAIPPDVQALTDLDAALRDLTNRIANVDLRTLGPDDMAALAGSLDTVSARLQRIDRAAQDTTGAWPPEISNLLAQARRFAAFADLASQLARGLGVKDTSSVLERIRGVAALAGQDVDMTMFQQLAPLADLLRSGKQPTPAQLYRLIVSMTPATLSTDLQLDLDRDCKDEATWQCWSTRLALSLQDAVSIDGSHVTIDTKEILTDMSSYGEDKRREQTWKPYLHLAVGGGVLYDHGNTPPLVAEQIGVGVTMYRAGPFSLRAAAFGSGLLYRLVLDSKESNGVMLGGGVMLGVEDLVELYAGMGVLLEPSMDQSDGTAVRVFMFGAQVPLSDYLSRL